MHWYKDEEIWKAFYDCMFDNESFNLAEIQTQQLLSLVGYQVGSVIDFACGPGRHCIPLAKMGYDTTGVDSSHYLLSRAEENVQNLGVPVNFHLQDMLEYKHPEKVDLIINMFNSFGYFENPEKNQQFVDNVYDNLNTEGTFIIDTVGKETLARIIEPVHLSEYDNGDLRIERPMLIDDMQVFSNEWILVKADDTVFRREYQHYVYTPVELSTMCYKSGFDEVEIYGSLEGDEYNLDSERLVIVARKS